MKKKHLLHVLFALLLLNVTAEAQSSELEKPAQTWTTIQNDQGVRVSCSTYKLSGKTYLELEFENSTDILKEFSWTLTIGANSYSSAENVKIEAMSSILITQSKTRFLFEDGESQALTTVNLNFE